MSLQIHNLDKAFNGIPVFRDFSITFPENTITCILGPSGCGKTTLLNIIGGIAVPDGGRLVGFEGKRFSYIFQEPRLLPWKTVKGNIEFVLGWGITAEERQEQTGRLLQLVGLEKFSGHYPSQLSGGMRQRVAIARAFASPSDVILMDEPLTGLDVSLKKNMMQWFSKIWQADKRTVVFVTHDVDEALMLGDEIIVLSKAPAKIISCEKIEKTTEGNTAKIIGFKKIKQILLDALNQQ